MNATVDATVEFLDKVPPPIAAALVRAQRKVTPLGKSKEGPGYRYTGMEDLLDLGRRLLNEQGLALIPGNLDVATEHVGDKSVKTETQTIESKTIACTAVRYWILIHEDGDALTIRVSWPLYLQGGKRSRDKGTAVADTTMLGYLYRDLLSIPRLTEEQMDARDDRDTSEVAAEPDEPGPHKRAAAPPPAKKKAAPPPDVRICDTTGKRRFGSKAAAKKANAKNAARLRFYTCTACRDWHATAAEKNETKPDKAAKKAAAERDRRPDRVNGGTEEPEGQPEAPVEAQPERGTGTGGTTKKGKTTVGQTYGAKAEEVGAAQAEAMSDEERDAEIRQALTAGITPSTTSDQLVVELPPDPGADDIEGAGWPREVADELVGFAESDPVPRETLNVITRKAAELMGLSFKDAKPMLLPAFEGVGVNVKKQQVPNGYQLRLWCVSVGGIASAHAEAAAE